MSEKNKYKSKIDFSVPINYEKISSQSLLEEKKYIRSLKIKKYSYKLFKIIGFSSTLFVLWVGSGFYDLIPNYKLEERMEEYKLRRELRNQGK